MVRLLGATFQRIQNGHRNAHSRASALESAMVGKTGWSNSDQQVRSGADLGIICNRIRGKSIIAVSSIYGSMEGNPEVACTRARGETSILPSWSSERKVSSVASTSVWHLTAQRQRTGSLSHNVQILQYKRATPHSPPAAYGQPKYGGQV